ncbi:MAG: flagellin [Phycisphaerales bacterium]|nr:MAG: flagellin [Phycisphaerales bacterium]
MSRINSNVPSLIAQRHLSGSQHALRLSLERLSSGLKINRGADDPAGLIVSERLRSEIAVVRQAIDNSSRAINVIATTEGALDEVQALLTDIQALLVEAANSGAFSDEEMAANQLQIDNAIDSITRIANTTTFAGRKLINGELDYVTSGVVWTELADVDVLAAKFGSRPYVSVDVEVLLSAQKAELSFAQAGLGSTGVTLDIRGNDGIVTLTFPVSATTAEMANAINAQVDATGVIAVASGTDGASGMRIVSLEYGSDAFVAVREMDTDVFTVTDRDGQVNDRTDGRDAVATINGISATADGLELSYSSTLLKLETTLAESFGNGSTGLGSSSFAITEGGALFQLGPQVSTNQQENIGVKSMQANKLGNSVVGFLSELKTGQPNALDTGNFQQASKIVQEVITQVAVLRGRLGAFERNTLQPNIRQLQITTENLTASESTIRDTDFAEETSELTRSQILVQAGSSILAIANAQSQNVLTLLGG